MDRDVLLQPPLQGDERMAALARLIARLTALPADAPLVNLFDLVDASALASLGEQFHVMGVEGWNLAATEAARRSLLKKAIELHRYKGTPWAVEEALRATGYAGAEVREGGGLCAHDGEISHNGAGTYASGNRWAVFDVEVVLGESAGIDAAGRARIRETVNAWKNARSHLRALSWRTSLEDETAFTDGTWLAVRPEYEDVRKWGFPLHDGSIRYDNGLIRAHNGRLRYGGLAPHTRWEPDGQAHDALMDPLAVALRPKLTDSVRYSPRHDAAISYQGQGRHSDLDVAALDEAQALVTAMASDSVSVSDSGSTTLAASVVDDVARYHDGQINHGQRYGSIRNGAFFHDNSRLRGPFGGNASFVPLRRNGKARHNGTAQHRLWGWLSTAGTYAPAFVYAGFTDLQRAAVGASMVDSIGLTDGTALRVLRYALHNAAAAHDATRHYYGEEIAA